MVTTENDTFRKVVGLAESYLTRQQVPAAGELPVVFANVLEITQAQDFILLHGDGTWCSRYAMTDHEVVALLALCYAADECEYQLTTMEMFEFSGYSKVGLVMEAAEEILCTDRWQGIPVDENEDLEDKIAKNIFRYEETASYSGFVLLNPARGEEAVDVLIELVSQS